MKKIKKYRNVVLRVFDVFVIAVAYFIAKIIVNEPDRFAVVGTSVVLNTTILAIVVYSSMLHICKTYKNITR